MNHLREVTDGSANTKPYTFIIVKWLTVLKRSRTHDTEDNFQDLCILNFRWNNNGAIFFCLERRHKTLRPSLLGGALAGSGVYVCVCVRHWSS